RFEFANGLPDFIEAGAVRPAVFEQAVPVFLGAEVGGVPAKIVDAHRSMRNRLIGPEAKLPRFRLGREGWLPGLAGLLFHDEEWLAVFHTAHKVVAERDHCS